MLFRLFFSAVFFEYIHLAFSFFSKEDNICDSNPSFLVFLFKITINIR